MPRLPTNLLAAFRAPAAPPPGPPAGVAPMAAALGGAPRRERQLSLHVQHQEQTNWCWAAVSTSVALHYDASSTWTQCGVANAELGQADCCGPAGKTTACNRYWSLNDPLSRVGHLAWWATGLTPFAGVITEIDGGNPLCCRTAWSGGGAHFVALRGYSEAPAGSGESDFVSVSDPWHGDSDETYDRFRTAYQGTGTWTHSYRCQP